MHIYKDHFGNNEKDKGQNRPLDIEDIRSLADVISSPDKIFSSRREKVAIGICSTSSKKQRTEHIT